MPRPSRYTPAEKAAIVAAARSRIRLGESCKDIALRLGVNQPSLRGWLRESTLDMLYPPLPPCMPRNRSASA
jgi:transposase-like protein